MKYLKFIVLAITITAGAGYYTINKPKASIANRNADYRMSPQHLLSEFESDETSANKRFLDKVISVEGKINSVSEDTSGFTTVVIETDTPMSNVSCQLNNEESAEQLNLKEGSNIKIKGICAGILMDVVLVDCVVEK